MIGLAYGVYLYKVAGTDAPRNNRWLEMSAQTNIGIHNYLTTSAAWCSLATATISMVFAFRLNWVIDFNETISNEY